MVTTQWLKEQRMTDFFHYMYKLDMFMLGGTVSLIIASLMYGGYVLLLVVLVASVNQYLLLYTLRKSGLIDGYMPTSKGIEFFGLGEAKG